MSEAPSFRAVVQPRRTRLSDAVAEQIEGLIASGELKPGFSLQGIDRQVWEFVARGPARAGPWNLATGDSIRVVRTATPFLEEFRRRLGAWESTHRLGDVLYRLRRDEERLSLSVDNLAEVLAPDAAAPILDLTLERVSASAGRSHPAYSR